MADEIVFRHSHGEDDMEGVVLAKLISMLVLFVASMICGFAPLVMAKKLNWISLEEAGNLKNTNLVVMALLSFGGGVLLSTTFMHLIPEVEENIAYLQRIGSMNEFDFKITPLLTCCGFFIMYLIEELVFVYINHREKKTGKNAVLVRSLSVRRSRGAERQSNGEKSVTNSTADLVDNEASKEKDPETFRHAQSLQSHMPVIEDDDTITNGLRGLLIILALSIHELFEGLAVGLESYTSHVWYMLGAISAHKLVLAFCVGVELIAARTKSWLMVVYITTFSIITSVGIGIGLLLVGGQGAAAAGVTSVILQGLASGTLIYVIFFEIWKGDKNGLLQYTAALVGFFVMFGLNLLTPHSHSHGDDDHGHGHGHGHSHN